MTLTLIRNREIRSNKKKLDTFLENFHDNYKEFTIDCEALNVDFFNSESIVKIRHRKPVKDSIYYAETYKDKNESAYFFGLGRENVIATSSYLDRGSQIKPILVAILNIEDSSKSNLVFAEDSGEINNVILLRIDCSQLSDLELRVLKDKNKISRLDHGKGFINFGAIGDFRTLTNIRNFISNVQFEFEDVPFIKIVSVSLPENYNELNVKPEGSIVKDRFINFGKLSLSGEEVIDSNQIDESRKIDSSEKNADATEINDAIDENLNEEPSTLSSDSDFNSNSNSIDLSGLIESEDLNLMNSSNSIVESELLDDEENLFKLFYIDEDSIFFELSIHKDDFFKTIRFINNIVDLTYAYELDLIEVIDMGDDILNMSLSIQINDEEAIDLINRILIKNDYVLRE